MPTNFCMNTQQVHDTDESAGSGQPGPSAQPAPHMSRLNTLFSGHTIDMASLLWVGPLHIEPAGPDNDDDDYRSAHIDICLKGTDRSPIRVPILEQYKERGRGRKEPAAYTEEDNRLWAETIEKAKQNRAELVLQWTNWVNRPNGQ